MTRARGVILVVLDSMRADSVSLAPDGETPNLAALSAAGTAFERAVAPAAWTLPSHVSMMTGLHPTEHGLQASPSAKEAIVRAARGVRSLAGAERFLPAWLASRGVDTFLGSANVWVSPASGFGTGFETVEYLHFPSPPSGRPREAAPHSPPRLNPSLRRVVPRPIKHGGKVVVEKLLTLKSARPMARWVLSRADKGGAHVVASLGDWLAQRRGPYFALLNLIETHDPHFPPRGFGPLDRRAALSTVVNSGRTLARRMNQHNWGYRRMSPAAIRRLREAYLGEVRYADHLVGRIRESLSASGILDDTCLIVTSDHGESFGEHGLMGHGVPLSESVLRVPLIASGPVGERGRVEEAVTLTAAAASVASLLGLADHPFPGGSWFSEEGRGRAQAEVEAPGSYFHSAGLRKRKLPPGMDRPAAAFYADGKKLIVGSFWGEALYDLAADPGEEQDLIGSASPPDELLEMRRAWEERVGRR